jgi:hypothetical protein
MEAGNPNSMTQALVRASLWLAELMQDKGSHDEAEKSDQLKGQAHTVLTTFCPKISL